MQPPAKGSGRPRGDKRGSWVTFRRRLILVRRLLRGPASVAELIQAAEDEQGVEAYPPAAAIAVRHDLQSLRDEFGCIISFQRAPQTYMLEELGDLALLDLPDDGLEALSLLDATFPEDGPIGSYDRVRLLISRIFALLPTSRRILLGRQFVLPKVHWAAAYDEAIDQSVLTTVQQALALRRQVSFLYRSNYDADDQPRHYQLAPYLFYFRDGHSYLDCNVIRAPADLQRLQQRAIQFRLDRVVPKTVRMLPDDVPDPRPPQPTYRLVYQLAAAIARNRDVAHWFPNTAIAYHADGSALVSAEVTNLWQARQILMRYIEHCQVLEPPELVTLMRQTAQRLAQIYAAPQAAVREE